MGPNAVNIVGNFGEVYNYLAINFGELGKDHQV